MKIKCGWWKDWDGFGEGGLDKGVTVEIEIKQNQLEERTLPSCHRTVD